MGIMRKKGANVAAVGKKKKVQSPKAKAIHASTPDGEHTVGIWNLHVFLLKDEKCWVAQGLEIDYVVQGDTIEEAKANFEFGLEKTIELNLKMYGNIEGLLVFAPDTVLQEAARDKKAIKLYSQVTTHDLGAKSEQALPFDGVRYLQMDGVAA
jgi:predicted RNase H-like HicB family nuclease